MVALPPLIADSGKTQKPKLKHQFQAEYDKFADKEFYKDFRFTFFPLPLPTEELPRKSVRCLVAWITECLVWSLNTRSTRNFEHGINQTFYKHSHKLPTSLHILPSKEEYTVCPCSYCIISRVSMCPTLDTMQCKIVWSKPGSVKALTPLNLSVPPPNRAYLRTLIHNADLEHLEKVVLDGHGHVSSFV